MNITYSIILSSVLKLSQGFISLVFIPIIVKYIGVEGYGEVSVVVTIQIWVAIFDFGLTTALARRLALPGHRDQKEIRSRIDTFEIIFWICGFIIFLLPLSYFFFRGWNHFQSGNFSFGHNASILFSLLTFQYWIISFYSMVLIGFGRNDYSNAIKTIIVVSQSIIIFLLFKYYFASPTSYIFGLCLANFIHIGVLVGFVGKQANSRLLRWREFHFEHLRQDFRLASGIFATNLFSSLVNHADKVVIYFKSTSVDYAEYMFVYQIASVVSAVGVQSYFVTFPRFANSLNAEREEAGFGERSMLVFWKTVLLMSGIFVGIAVHVVAFSKWLLEIVIDDNQRIERLYGLLCILVVTASINGVMVLIYSYQMATGRSGVSVYKNIISCCVVIPFLWIFHDKIESVSLFPRTLLFVAVAHYFIEPVAVFYPASKDKIVKWMYYSALLPLMCTVPCALIVRCLQLIRPVDRIMGSLVSVFISAFALYFCFRRLLK